MIRFVADENFDGKIVRGLRKRIPNLDILRVQDVGLAGAEDPMILEWAACQDRVLLTHDAATMTRFAYDRLRAGQPMPGVLEVSKKLAIGRAIQGVMLLTQEGTPVNPEGQVLYLASLIRRLPDPLS